MTNVNSRHLEQKRLFSVYKRNIGSKSHICLRCQRHSTAAYSMHKRSSHFAIPFWWSVLHFRCSRHYTAAGLTTIEQSSGHSSSLWWGWLLQLKQESRIIQFHH